MNNPLIQLTQVSAAYDEKPVLTHVNLTLYEKDFLGIIGPNGGGKTTLIKLMLGLLKPASGTISYYQGGVVVDKIKMGYLPQYTAIDKKFPISVYEVILSGLSGQKSLFGKFSAAQCEEVNCVMERMGLRGYEHVPIGALSGGELQRTLLSRAIVSNPDVLIMDEPNTYLDKRFEEQLYMLLSEINKERAIVLVSHDIGTILQNVKSVACVNETLDYHPNSEVPQEWLEEHLGCPIELLGHGQLPHRILRSHTHVEDANKKP